jgi:alpha-L-fucosidase
VQFRHRVPLDEYAALADRFTAEKFDADQITDLACDARMTYVNLVTCHHDSFCMWDSKVEPFNSVRSAAKRDFVAEMAEQCRKKKLGFVTYYTYGLNWRHPYYVDRGRMDFARPHYAAAPAAYRYRQPADFRKYVDYMHAAVAELLTDYGPITGMWFDLISAAHAMPELIPVAETYDLVRRLQPGCLIAYKQGATGTEDVASCEFQAGSLESMMRDQYGDRAGEIAKHAWAVNSRKRNEVCATLAHQWGWAMDDIQKSPGEVWTLLANAAGKNCNLLLNVGPHPDGSLPPDAVKTLREVGRRIDREGFPQPPAESGRSAEGTSLPV